MLDHSPCILIVDDSATTRAMIKRVIEMTDSPVQTLEARDGHEALEQMKSKPVDLVLADLNMPVMGGAKMISLMRQDPALRKIPVLVISAQPDDEQIERLKHEGVAGYLPKPFTPEGVRDLIEPLLKPQPPQYTGEQCGPSSWNLMLTEVLSEALETMAFITPESVEAAAALKNVPDMRLLRVGFHGQGINGSLTLAATLQFGAMLASNCGDSDAMADADDVLKELANVTCGLMLRRREGGARGFEMAPPLVEVTDNLDEFFTDCDSVVLEAEGLQIAAHVLADAAFFAPQGSIS